MPVYRTGPVDQLGRGQQRVEVLSPSALPRARPLSGRRLPPDRFTLHGAEDGELESQGLMTPPAFQTGTTTW
jgi:hypothetical protein